ncbi:MAG TPA: ABC transporter ATP-binding protein [Telluria sp.]|nr:ABC transporter ATP-binding protein [Telluria sp.]
METELLRVTQLTKAYGGRRAVDGVSFTVSRGQTVGLLGPNGAGKSTTVGMICGLIAADSGSVTLEGRAVTTGANGAKRRIGFVPQDLALYEDLSALENLKLFAALYGLKGAHCRRRADEVLALVNLSERAHDKPATFSGGMRRRLNIAAALMHDPELLILDEPTVGVDPQSRNAIFDTLDRLKADGCALIYTSHYMEEVERLADRIVIVDHGKVLVDDTPEGLFRKLPAHAALRVDFDSPVGDALLDGARGCAGVTGVAREGDGIEIKLAAAGDALPVMSWLSSQGARPTYFATARASLEDIFLNLTGRTLRD